MERTDGNWMLSQVDEYVEALEDAAKTRGFMGPEVRFSTTDRTRRFTVSRIKHRLENPDYPGDRAYIHASGSHIEEAYRDAIAKIDSVPRAEDLQRALATARLREISAELREMDIDGAAEVLSKMAEKLATNALR